MSARALAVAGAEVSAVCTDDPTAARFAGRGVPARVVMLHRPPDPRGVRRLRTRSPGSMSCTPTTAAAGSGPAPCPGSPAGRAGPHRPRPSRRLPPTADRSPSRARDVEQRQVPMAGGRTGTPRSPDHPVTGARRRARAPARGPRRSPDRGPTRRRAAAGVRPARRHRDAVVARTREGRRRLPRSGGGDPPDGGRCAGGGLRRGVGRTDAPRPGPLPRARRRASPGSSRRTLRSPSWRSWSCRPTSRTSRWRSSRRWRQVCRSSRPASAGSPRSPPRVRRCSSRPVTRWRWPTPSATFSRPVGARAPASLPPAPTSPCTPAPTSTPSGRSPSTTRRSPPADEHLAAHHEHGDRGRRADGRHARPRAHCSRARRAGVGTSRPARSSARTGRVRTDGGARTVGRRPMRCGCGGISPAAGQTSSTR